MQVTNRTDNNGVLTKTIVTYCCQSDFCNSYEAIDDVIAELNPRLPDICECAPLNGVCDCLLSSVSNYFSLLFFAHTHTHAQSTHLPHHPPPVFLHTHQVTTQRRPHSLPHSHPLMPLVSSWPYRSLSFSSWASLVWFSSCTATQISCLIPARARVSEPVPSPSIPVPMETQVSTSFWKTRAAVQDCRC